MSNDDKYKVDVGMDFDLKSNLTYFSWYLIRANNVFNNIIPDVVPTDRVTVKLAFNKNRLTVTSMSNKLTAEYAFDDMTSKLIVFQLKDEIFETSDLAINATKGLLSELKEARMISQGEYSAPILVLKDVYGNCFSFFGVFMPEIYFNMQGEIVYLEVLNESGNCDQPYKYSTCLLIREVKYENGDFVIENPTWCDYPNLIQNYEYTGLTQIIKVKKFAHNKTKISSVMLLDPFYSFVELIRSPI